MALKGSSEKQKFSPGKGSNAPPRVASISHYACWLYNQRYVNRIIDKIVDQGSPVAASRVLAFTKRFFAWCKKLDILEKSPAETIKASSKEIIRDRV